MLAGAQNYPVYRVLVQSEQARRGPDSYALGCMMDDRTNRFRRQMQAKKRAGLGGGKAFATGATVKQIAAFVLAVLATHGNVASIAQPIILAFLIRTEMSLKLDHRLPPHERCIHLEEIVIRVALNVNQMGTLPIFFYPPKILRDFFERIGVPQKLL